MPASVDLEKKYNEPGVPVTVLHLPGDVEKHLGGIFDKEDLIEVLNKLPDVSKEE